MAPALRQRITMIEISNPIDTIPLIVVFAVLVGTAFVIVEIGYFLGTRHRRDQGLDKYPMESSAKTSVLGLLAFLLAFSFGVNSSRYGEIRSLARQDTTAIGEVYNLCDFVDGPEADQVRALLRDYHAMRFHAVESRDRDKMADAIARSGEIHDELWRYAVSIRRKSDNSVLNQFVSGVRSLMDTHDKRIHKAAITRMPATLWATLVGLLLLSALALGFTSALHGRRSRLAVLLVVISFTAVVVMIVDLDRPIRTLFQYSDPAANALLEQMNADAQGRTN